MRHPLRVVEGEARPARDQPRRSSPAGAARSGSRASAALGFAKELILTGRLVDAEEALRVGLVNAVLDPDELLARTLELARLLASKSPVALAAAKEATNRALHGDLDGGLDDEATLFAALFASEDAREGMTAFAEKREPRFVGR